MEMIKKKGLRSRFLLLGGARVAMRLREYACLTVSI